MNFDLFSSLVQNLLHTTVTELTEEGCLSFAGAYCHLPLLQRIYTAENLLEFCGAAIPDQLYDLRDLLGVNALALKAEERTWLVGPFVSREFMEAHFHSLLSEKGYAASYLSSLKLYYSKLPLLDRKTAADTVLGIVKSLMPLSQNFPIISIRCDSSPAAALSSPRPDSIDYASIYRRYEQESRFMHAVESGDTEHILTAFENLNTTGLNTNSSAYVSAIYQEPTVALAILRTLARKAAEMGGASVVEIDEITQRATQSMMKAKNLYAAQKITISMLVELTEAVRQSHETFGRLSPPIRSVVEHLKLHYSQDMSLGMLAEVAGLSASYLSFLFKQETGQTITDYLAGLRIEQARRLLKESELPISEISSFVGYSDNNYFIKVFRRHYGMTPGDYRKHGR